VTTIVDYRENSTQNAKHQSAQLSDTEQRKFCFKKEPAKNFRVKIKHLSP